MLLRLCDVYQVPLATNFKTAEILLNILKIFKKMKVVGVDIGGTNTELAVVDSRDGILKISAFKTKASDSFADYIVI